VTGGCWPALSEVEGFLQHEFAADFGEELQVGLRLEVRVGPVKERNAALPEIKRYFRVDALANVDPVCEILRRSKNQLGGSQVPGIEIHPAAPMPRRHVPLQRICPELDIRKTSRILKILKNN